MSGAKARNPTLRRLGLNNTGAWPVYKQMERPESALLMDRARQGDVDAFAELFEQLRSRVFTVAWRLVGSNDAEDVVMETYLKAWKALPGFNQRASLETWLYRIAHNCAVDVLRKRRPLPDGQREPVDVEALADPRARPPDEAAAASDLAREVRQALDTLSPEHRTALRLRYSDGLSYAEIAAATGVSIGTVMSRLFNGKRRLQQQLKALAEELP
jgi:RNA polymerase sigma-70 factor, ECF subfamily